MSLIENMHEYRQSIKRLQILTGELITGADPEERKAAGRKAAEVLQSMFDSMGEDMQNAEEVSMLAEGIDDRLSNLQDGIPYDDPEEAEAFFSEIDASLADVIGDCDCIREITGYTIDLDEWPDNGESPTATTPNGDPRA